MSLDIVLSLCYELMFGGSFGCEVTLQGFGMSFCKGWSFNHDNVLE